MAIITEDGTGKPDAEAYCDVAYVRAYCDGRGLALTGVADPRIEQLLRQAADFMAVYTSSWQGCRAVRGQALDWPRAGVMFHDDEPVPADSVPKGVKDACALLAYKAISGPLVRDEKPVKTKVKVGPLEVERDKDAPQQTVFVDVGRMLAPYLKPFRGYSVTLERA